MQITIFGASGKIGVRLTELALKHGYTVIAFVHSHDPFQGTPNLIVQKGDVHDPSDVAQAINGSGAVFSTLGSWGTSKRDVLTSAMQAIIPVMEQAGIKRLITLTGTGVSDPSKPLGSGQKAFLKLLSPFPVGKVFSDGEQHLRLLAASSLDWTTICSPVMTSFGSQGYALSTKAGNPLTTVHRQAVAMAMLDQLDTTDFIRQAPAIHRK